MATIQQIKDAAGAHIALVHGYTVPKQLNIQRLGNGFTQTDLDTMSAFIDAVRVKSNELEAQADGQVEQFENVLALYSAITP